MTHKMSHSFVQNFVQSYLRITLQVSHHQGRKTWVKMEGKTIFFEATGRIRWLDLNDHDLTLIPHFTRDLRSWSLWNCVVSWLARETSCRRAAATICPAPLLPLWAPKRSEPTAALAHGNVAVGSHGEYFPTLTAAAAWCVNAAVSKAAWWPWPFDLESGVRVTFDVGYVCANFGLPRPLCSRLRPDVRDTQTSDSIVA